MKNGAPWLLALTACFSLLAGNAQAQPSSDPKNKQGQGDKPNDEEFNRVTLKNPVDLPYVPEIQGKKHFLSGMSMPAALHGPSYILNFGIKAPPQEVLSWYASSLPSHGWKIKKQMKHMLDASHKEGHTCIVMVQMLPPSTAKESEETKLSLYYHVHHR